MPVTGGDDELEPVDEAVERPSDLVPACDCEGAARREVILEIDDQQRIQTQASRRRNSWRVRASGRRFASDRMGEYRPDALSIPTQGPRTQS
jgi:hypothetical protein